MSTLLDALQGQLTNSLLKTAADHLGVSESQTATAASGLGSTILAGMAGKAGESGALSGVFDMLSRPEIAGFLDNPAGLLGGGNLAQGDPRDLAGGLVGSLFGDKVSGILDTVADMAGLKREGASSILGMVGPIVMGMLSKRILSGGLDLGGFASLLRGEKADIERAVPAGIASLIGLPVAAASPAAPAAVAAYPKTPFGGTSEQSSVTATERDGGVSLLWLVPLLLLLGVAAYAFLGRGGGDAPAVTTPAPVEDNGVDMDAAANAEADDPVVIVAEPDLEVVMDARVATDGVESSLIGFIESGREPCTEADCWFTMDRLTFETGGAMLDMERSTAQLGNIVRIMEAYPNIQLKIGGYTDGTGPREANMALSQDRADAVAAALATLGVAPERLVSEGYGPDFPVASDETEEGRAQNRRIDVRVRNR